MRGWFRRVSGALWHPSAVPAGTQSGRQALLCCAGLVLAVACLSGCSLAGALLPQPTPTPTVTVTPTVTPTSTPTATPTPTSTPTPTVEPLRLLLNFHPAQVRQGHTLVLEVLSNRAIHASGAVDGGPLTFIPKADGAWALVGMAANAEAGPHPVQLAIVDDLGASVSTTVSLVVLDEDFGTEQIHIPADRMDLLDAQLVAEEAEHLGEVFAQVTARQLWLGTFHWPVAGRVTSPFGILRGYNDGHNNYHAGVDIAGEMGTPVLAANTGRVVLAAGLKVHGNAVIVDHGWGVYSAYYHLSDILVQEGQAVSAGDVVGTLGNTGLSTGAHLHWEMRVGGVAVDPLEWTARSIPAEG